MSAVTPYTAEEREPFAGEPYATVIDNVFCKGHVADREADPLFAGWIVLAKRPLGEYERRLAYANHGTIFPDYQAALDAVQRTVDEMAANFPGAEWFVPKWRIFSVARRAYIP